MKILIADDSAEFRKRVRNLIMKHKDVQVVGEPENGIETMQLILDTEPEMIILDIRMPQMNGIQVLKEIKKQGIKTAVCILTSYPYPQYKKKCLAEGADYFFNKSEDFEKINLAIQKILKNNRNVSVSKMKRTTNH